jgi:hypothetical protein
MKRQIFPVIIIDTNFNKFTNNHTFNKVYVNLYNKSYLIIKDNLFYAITDTLYENDMI